MHTLSPSLDRLGAALSALRHTDETGGADKMRLGIKCLAVVIRQLAEEGLSQEDLSPLVHLETELKQGMGRGERPRERRVGGPANEDMLARVAAAIDLMVKGGYDEADAAQVMMRKMIGAGMAPPRQGGDARGWKRLLFWRADLAYGLATDQAKAEYKAFTAEIDEIPPTERLKRVIDGQLWDRRRKAR